MASVEQVRIAIAVEEAERAGVLSASPLKTLVGLSALDDCAVIELTGGLDLVVGSDFVRGTEFHLFREGILSHRDLGWYLVAANLSDLAAMGATPVGIVVALRYAKSMSDHEWRKLLRGVCLARISHQK